MSNVHAPVAVGVNVAVYTDPDDANAESVPFVTAISPISSNPVTVSDGLNVNANVASFELSPEDTSAAVIVK